MLKLCIIVLAAALPLHTTAQEVQIIEPLRGVTFKREALGNGSFKATRLEHYDTKSIALPAWSGPVQGRGYLLHVLATERPAGTSTMWLSWSFTSKGVFSSNPAAHAFFATRSTSTALSNVGQGFIVGGLSGVAQAVGGPCAPGYRAQPETWHELLDGTAGNVVLGGGYCSPPLQEYRKYSVWVHSQPDGYGYGITDTVTGQIVQSVYVPNGSSPSAIKLEKGTGFTAGVVFADSPGTSWEFEISDLQMGWF